MKTTITNTRDTQAVERLYDIMTRAGQVANKQAA
jgi:hypothetical protein